MKGKLFLLGSLSFFILPALSSAASISIFPEKPIQGEPLMISIVGTTTFSGARDISFDGKVLAVFMHKNQPTALYGIDLYKNPSTYKITARLKDGTVLEKEVTIGKREKIEAPLGIPQKLGGNTAVAAKNLVDTLAIENASFIGLRTGTHAFWTSGFRYPLANPIITDSYGYSRSTVGYSISHKGTDFRAGEGTMVFAMNRGVVRIAREYRNYGNTVIVDHGLGLMTFYMHLSKMSVNVGELVLPGQLVGLSGKTGYAEQPHLHVTVRINDVSIDPLKFIELLK